MPASKVVRAVVWDFGGVLVRTEDGRARAAWEKRLGLFPGDLGRLVFDGHASQRAMVGDGTSDDVWRWVGTQLALGATELAALRVEFFSGDRVDRDLIDRIRGLRPAYRTGMVSNAWPDLRRVLVSRYPIADAFDTIVISGEEHVAKPDPEIFQRALERLQVEPAQAVMIDDMEVNIAAARDFGMLAIRFENPIQAWSALQPLLATKP